MLVLSRKIGEAIVIGNNIRITVVDVGQGRVKIGVMAPHNVSVDREEIFEKKQAERYQEDPEEAIPINMGLHNRIATQLPNTSENTPAPTPKLSFRAKSR
ncbi:carbon storage regulator CsrA [Limnoglobus roseus]|uniref:Translational regulator CsrA n=1 Tax=Limnoglobus roseus TaxID=2598579 RepID=A0A5C1ASS9_9BACT|nr:carbon storage regulator CsrA [Limnoglobus roseus]QEL19968.1 carbon storage regulator [Limnoglobus roseus]